MTEQERAMCARIRSVLAEAGYYTLFRGNASFRSGEIHTFAQAQLRCDASESRGLGRIDTLATMSDEELCTYVGAKFARPSTRTRDSKRQILLTVASRIEA